MPFVQRIVSPTNLNYLTQEKQQQPLVVINDEETTTNVDENDRNRYIVVQFVNLVRQIADVARHSENILMQIFNDSLAVNQRWQRLEKRMEAIKTNVDGLNANAVEIASAGDIGRFVQVEKHFSSVANDKEDNDGDITETNLRRLFVVETRPRHIRNLCQSNQNKKRSSADLIGFEDGSTQTEDDSRRRRRAIHFRHSTPVVNDVEETTMKLLSTTFQADSKHSSSSSNSFLSVAADESFRRRQNGPIIIDDARSLSSSNNDGKSFLKVVDETSRTTSVTTVPVDTTGFVLKRMSAMRKSRSMNYSSNDNNNFHRSSMNNRSSMIEETINKTFSEEDYGRKNKNNNVDQTTTPRKLHRCSRRNTIAVVDLKNVDNGKRQRSLLDKGSSTARVINPGQNFASEKEDNDEFESTTMMADEYFYDFAPFYRRRTKRSLLSSVNQFFSLRRPSSSSKKKEKTTTKITTSATFDDFRQSVDRSSSSPMPPIEFVNLSTLRSPQKRRQETTTPTSNGQNGLKQFFKRTLSLHLSSTKKSKKLFTDNDYLYDSLPFRRPKFIQQQKNFNGSNGYCNSPEIIDTQSESPKSNQFTRHYSIRPKSNLPITVESQVFNVATVLRNQQPASLSSSKTNDATIKQHSTTTTKGVKAPSPSSSRDSAYSSCGKKVRPLSVVSTGSIASLDLNEKNAHNGWYRQGYQLEYPDECLNNNNTSNNVKKTEAPTNNCLKISSPRLIVSTVPSDIFERKSSSRSPYSDVSSINDSNYSCDQEGYFTSMHRDSGLIHRDTGHRPKIETRCLNDFRGRSFSTHSSTSTVAAEPNCDDDGSPAASDVVVDSSNESTSSTSFLLKDKIADVSARRAFPPLCEISLSESSDNDTIKKTRPKTQSFDYRTPPPPSTINSFDTTQRIDAFDRWLLSKFQAEMTLKQQNANLTGDTNGWRCYRTNVVTTNGHSMPRRRRKEQNNNEIVQFDKYLADEIDSSLGCYNNHTVPRKSVRFVE